MMKTQTIILLSLVFVLGCKSNQNNAKMKTIEPILIAKGNLHGAGSEGIDKQNIIIDNQADWENLISKMDKVNKVSEQFTETKIDFSRYTVIAIFNDVMGSGGHSIAIDISANSERILVVTKFHSPSGNATSVMTQPYYIAKITKTERPIVFQ